jgi:hypothetical protein
MLTNTKKEIDPVGVGDDGKKQGSDPSPSPVSRPVVPDAEVPNPESLEPIPEDEIPF